MNFQTNDIKPTDFSSYLFWDVDIDTLNLESSAPLVIERVLQLGQLEDWSLLNLFYGIDKILEVAKNLNSLDDLTVSFLCSLYDLKKEEFKCYTQRQSNPHFWSY